MQTQSVNKTAGQKAYEQEIQVKPNYEGGVSRRPWKDLSEVAQMSWERNPSPRF